MARGVLRGPSWATAAGPVHSRVTTRAAGDLNPDTVARSTLLARRRAVVDLPWTQLDQVHGATVVAVGAPGEADGAAGDALVTEVAGAALAVWAGDCAPVVLVSGRGHVAVAHAGWRGLAAGVLEATVEALRRRGASSLEAVLGPCIHACCYEFGPAELEVLVDRYGPGVVGRTTRGGVALDVPAAVATALAGAGVAVEGGWPCTGCDERFYSHRVRAERGRHAVVVWREAA